MRRSGRSQSLKLLGRRGVLLLMLLPALGCSSPGAMAPSTVPLPPKYVELGPPEESSSCGVVVMMLPFANPKPVSDVVQDLIKVRGGDALVDVSSESTGTFFLLGKTNCVTVRGTVVRFQP